MLVILQKKSCCEIFDCHTHHQIHKIRIVKNSKITLFTNYSFTKWVSWRIQKSLCLPTIASQSESPGPLWCQMPRSCDPATDMTESNDKQGVEHYDWLAIRNNILLCLLYQPWRWIHLYFSYSHAPPPHTTHLLWDVFWFLRSLLGILTGMSKL